MSFKYISFSISTTNLYCTSLIIVDALTNYHYQDVRVLTLRTLAQLRKYYEIVNMGLFYITSQWNNEKEFSNQIYMMEIWIDDIFLETIKLL